MLIKWGDMKGIGIQGHRSHLSQYCSGQVWVGEGANGGIVYVFIVLVAFCSHDLHIYGSS